MNLETLSDQELDALLQNEFKVLQLIQKPGYGFEKLSRQTLESLQNEALDKIIHIQKEKKRRYDDRNKK